MEMLNKVIFLLLKNSESVVFEPLASLQSFLKNRLQFFFLKKSLKFFSKNENIENHHSHIFLAEIYVLFFFER